MARQLIEFVLGKGSPSLSRLSRDGGGEFVVFSGRHCGEMLGNRHADALV